ncbi:MAG: hypothetical protein LH481_14340 [Burkholderiales bacterium]|nr:hypothetical protein [Burkholderiales bacterium]
MKRYAAFPTVLLVALLGIAAPTIAIAQETKTVAPMRDVLLSNVGKRVALRLSGDQDIEGTVVAVGADTVLLSKLSGKDFYDAVIVISKVSAVSYKAR